MKSKEWINTKNKLPDDGQIVIGLDRGTPIVVKFKIGLSKVDRLRMKVGEVPEIYEEVWCLTEGWHTVKRSNVFHGCDEGSSNNVTSYGWETSYGTICGQNICLWFPIPRFK